MSVWDRESGEGVECSLCGMPYATLEQARHCETQGRQEPIFEAGTELMAFDGSVLIVTGMFGLTVEGHHPGITFTASGRYARWIGVPEGTRQVISWDLAQDMRNRFLETR